VAIAVFDPRLMILPSVFKIRFKPLFPGEPPAGNRQTPQYKLSDSSPIKTVVKDGVAVMLQTHIQKIASSNLGWIIGYLNYDFYGFPQFLQANSDTIP
jgi:hypothetical protein